MENCSLQTPQNDYIMSSGRSRGVHSQNTSSTKNFRLHHSSVQLVIKLPSITTSGVILVQTVISPIQQHG